MACMSLAVDVGASKVMMMCDEGGAHAESVRGEAAIEHDARMNGSKDGSKRAIRGLLAC